MRYFALLLLAVVAFAPLGNAWAAAGVINVTDPLYGAKGDCVTDDSAALATAESAALVHPRGSMPVVYLPAGCYALGAQATLPLIMHSIRIRGDGTHSTYLRVLPTYVGDIFSTSEVWQASAYHNGMSLTSDNAGVEITGISIFGDKTSPNVNNALAFYDRNNFIVVRDVEVFYLNGACLLTGATKNQAAAYVRESLFYNLRCNNTGTTTRAAVDLSSTAIVGDDATNELQFFGLNIFASAGVGLAIRNPNDYNSTRDITFFGPRVEFSAGDDIQIGSAGDAGQVSSIRMFGVEAITPGQTNAGHYGINLDTSGHQLYDILIQGGAVGPCWAPTLCNGVNIGNVRLARVQLDNIATSGPNVTYASSVGSAVVLDGNGNEKNWTYSIANGVSSLIRTPLTYVGDPRTKP